MNNHAYIITMPVARRDSNSSNEVNVPETVIALCTTTAVTTLLAGNCCKHRHKYHDTRGQTSKHRL